jgi:large subunit ribosomal protein L25
MAITKATWRSETGSRKARRLREQGDIPGVIYGHGEPTRSITISEHDVELALQHGERVLELDIEGKNQTCLIKEVQWDTFGQEVLHVDLARVDLDERVEVTVPIILRGTPKGVTEGEGVLQQVLAETTVECTVRSMPEEIRLSVVDLDVNENLTLADLELPEGAALVDEPDSVVCTVTYVTVEEELEEEAEAPLAEPEVIGEREEEEEEGEGEAAPEEEAE